MSGGLSNEQKRELRFVRHLVAEVEAFSLDRFSEMERQYEKADKDIFVILKTSRELAQKNYDRYLDAKVLRLGGVSSIGFEEVIDGQSTILNQVTNKLRSEAYQEKEFRGRYLNQALLESTQNYDLKLRKAHCESERQKRIEEKKLGKKTFSWGFGR